MDPDQALKEIRQLTRDLLELGDMGVYPTNEQALELAQKVEDLDNWLMSGGDAPVDWQKDEFERYQKSSEEVPDDEEFWADI